MRLFAVAVLGAVALYSIAPVPAGRPEHLPDSEATVSPGSDSQESTPEALPSPNLGDKPDHSNAALTELHRRLHYLTEKSLRPVAELVDALFLAGVEPSRILGPVLETTDAEAPRDHHSVPVSNILKGFVLDRYRDHLKTSSPGRNQQEAPSVLSVILPVAKRETDLAVVRGIFKLISKLSDDPRRHYEEILRSRDPMDRAYLVGTAP